MGKSLVSWSKGSEQCVSHADKNSARTAKSVTIKSANVIRNLPIPVKPKRNPNRTEKVGDRRMP